MAKRTFDRFGFDKDGYNKDGYDRMGYNRQGYDRQGYNKQGLNIRGINKLTGFDEEGYDADGFNESGVDRDGYHRDGFNEAGYNRDGFDREGFDIDGFDTKGFDRSGFNKAGFDVLGYDRNGYDRYGFDKNGIDCEGFNKSGYDNEGYDRKGFDYEGFDREGFNNIGFDRSGFDRDGYNSAGFDKDGFNRQGFDFEGFDRDGYSAYGFDKKGYDRNGFSLHGIDKDGRNILGFDADGFDKNGMSINGYSRDMFDTDGFHIYTGYDLRGFDREGFNINGINLEGYNRDGYHSITGFDKQGFDVTGFDKSGYDRSGFDKNGYNRDGFDKNGFDKDGFNSSGYNQAGFNRKGYNRQGYDINGYDENGSLSPELSEKEKNRKQDSKQDLLERAYFKKCENQIRGYFQDQVRTEVMKEYVPITRTYIDRWGFIQTDTREPNIEAAEREVRTRVNAVLREPYFAHVDYRDNAELYLGKQAVHGWITDWADERAQLYYQYQIYIGNKETDLHFVRDIHFVKGQYKGYTDKYNVEGGKDDINVSTDKYLAQIIEANRNSKRIHDIVETIQRNQYNIITADKDQSMLVIGCAGSGKTMILMHKIRYMKYNNSEMKMSDIIVLSPTDVLGRESKELSKLLQIDKIQQFTTSSFYERSCKELYLKLGITYEEFHVIDEDLPIPEYYSEETLQNIVWEVNNNIKSSSYLTQQQVKTQELLDTHIALTKRSKKTITEMHKLYIASVKEIRRSGTKDIERILRQIDREIKQRELTEDTIDILTILKEQNCFTGNEQSELSEVKRLFVCTQKMISTMNCMEFIWAKNQIGFRTNNLLQVIQIIQLYMDEKLQWDDIQSLFQEWGRISAIDVEVYIEFLKSELERYDHLEVKREILQYLLDNAMVMKQPLEDSSFTYLKSFEKLVTIYEELGTVLDEIGYTLFSYFEEYEKVARRIKRIKEQKTNNTRRDFLFDAILDKLDIEYDKATDIIIPKSKAFVMTFILQKYVPTLSTDKCYIYIDEFQDFSPSELSLIKDLYPSATTSLFGDMKQCINVKGIRRKEDIPSSLYLKEYQINENYRNARQITNYVKTEVGIEMLPVGLDGKMEIVEDIPVLHIEDDDRVAVIVERTEVFKHNYSIDKEVNYYSDSKEIVRGILNVIPVSMTKGLEFEKVILIEEGMNLNEYYVGCTRAISELYVVKNKGKCGRKDLEDNSEILVGDNVSKEKHDSLLMTSQFVQ